MALTLRMCCFYFSRIMGLSQPSRIFSEDGLHVEEEDEEEEQALQSPVPESFQLSTNSLTWKDGRPGYQMRLRTIQRVTFGHTGSPPESSTQQPPHPMKGRIIRKRRATSRRKQPRKPYPCPRRQPLNTACCICLEDFEEGEGVGNLLCGHGFHLPCIRQWLFHHCTCPLCNAQITNDAGRTF
mmetsp:Transcript_2747/g.3595  ORF Transcript_2747/g.3595 Transcript_2747/m.3595 type:complete len:183 (+) Transcript_2747:93-641(+)